jgi:hypothetical protein
MSKMRLEITLTWDEIDITKIHDFSTGEETDVSQLDGFDIAEYLERGYLPYPWKDKLDMLAPRATMQATTAIPIDGPEKARYYIERNNETEQGYEAWLDYTYPNWKAREREKMPGAQGFPDKKDPRHLRFSVRSLMSLMSIDDIHDVLYTDDYHLDYWDWKQKLLYQLQPARMGLGTT